jgi:hypothetical protein
MASPTDAGSGAEASNADDLVGSISVLGAFFSSAAIVNNSSAYEAANCGLKNN